MEQSAVQQNGIPIPIEKKCQRFRSQISNNITQENKNCWVVDSKQQRNNRNNKKEILKMNEWVKQKK
jgi:hypothetical protein